MSYQERVITDSECIMLFDIEENHFNDFKAKDIAARKLGKIISAFANASGGDIYVGIREENDTKIKHWEGFQYIEDANCFLQVLDNIANAENFYDIDFLKHPTLNTYVLKITIFKTNAVIHTADNKIFIRKGAQCLPVNTPEKIKRLELDKGITSYENETVRESELTDATESEVYQRFSSAIIPRVEPRSWLIKQRLVHEDKLTVAGELLFADEPQICLPKRSSIKIFRYKTSGIADRDMLAEQPITIEGCAYDLIYKAVSQTKKIIESIRKLENGFENVEYPEETLHEIITNAVLHRDYSIATDIQIRIFDNRVEVESPGKLPGHVTVKNILEAQAARNPKLVRLINKFPDAPNKDVGEGLNTAFDAMSKLRLKAPEIKEHENSVVVYIRHERLASPEDMVREYLENHAEITNSKGRALTGIKSENAMKRVFWKLRDQGLIEMIPGRAGSKSAWRKKL